jgi:filamentous hemagglutinin family protein
MKSKSTNIKSGYFLGIRGGISASLLSGFAIAFPTHSVLAQIIPDTTLGAEGSIVTPLTAQFNQIEGGAIRGVNLFHSFSEFNVGNGQSVYFVNPVSIENILSRVTGNNPSQILDTLGVLGNANLFLLNPNGIVFGANAQLDIRGSFVASTADSLVFDNGLEFSASNPEVPPLLTVNVPIGLQYGGKPPAAITNRGNLQVGGDLTLVGGRVNSLGKLATSTGEVRVAAVDGDVEVQDLSANSGIFLASNNLILEESQLQTTGDLILLAGNTVRVRDSVQKPFLAHTGGNLYIQGNQGIDILALNHPGTPFVSGGNLSLVSDGIISGDAHFASRGNFSILNLLGGSGNFVSLYDPIISSEGDVILGDYTGVALKIEAKGSITTGNITITGSDTTLTPGSDPDIAILRSSPALILRAGVEKLENPPTAINMPTPPTPPTPPQPPTPPGAIAVYDNNFEDPTKVGSEWSNTSTDITPVGCTTCTTFFGQFSNDNVSLTLNNLPAHTEATVSFDLFIIGAWDGNVVKSLLPFSPPVGPDIWELKADGSSKISTTFSNHGSGALFLRDQSYPAPYNPSNLTNNPAASGASETNILGYPNSIFASFGDSVYKFQNVAFPHSNNSLTLNFSASLRDPINDENWGLDNVKVSILPSPTPPITLFLILSSLLLVDHQQEQLQQGTSSLQVDQLFCQQQVILI